MREREKTLKGDQKRKKRNSRHPPATPGGNPSSFMEGERIRGKEKK